MMVAQIFFNFTLELVVQKYALTAQKYALAAQGAYFCMPNSYFCMPNSYFAQPSTYSCTANAYFRAANAYFCSANSRVEFTAVQYSTVQYNRFVKPSRVLYSTVQLVTKKDLGQVIAGQFLAGSSSTTPVHFDHRWRCYRTVLL